MRTGTLRTSAHGLLVGTLLTGTLLTGSLLARAPATGAPAIGAVRAVAATAYTAQTTDQPRGVQPRTVGRVPGELLVRFEAGVPASQRAAVRANVDARLSRRLPVRGLELLTVKGGVDAAVAALERRPEVRYAEPNYRYATSATPGDPGFPQLWGLHNTGQTVGGQDGASDADIDAPEAWDTVTGDPTVTVGVVDTGVDLDHPDLADNIWTNPAETANGVDDDDNGHVDDLHGWDWVERNDAPYDLNDHGTHVAGTIGAVGDNGIGVTGVAWDVSIMPLRALDAEGSGTLADVVLAFAYAGQHGADVVNASFGGPGESQAMADAIAGSPDTLFVAAAGNKGNDNDAEPTYPCSYPAPNLVCVAATDNRDALASFSNHGFSSVDLAAPGVDILSTLPSPTGSYDASGYGFLSGTSMASPHVAGAAALVKAADPDATVADLRTALLAGVDPLAALAGRTATGGRLNVERALSAPAQPVSVVAFEAAGRRHLENVGTVTLVVTRSGGTALPASVRYSADSGTARLGADYVLPAGTLTFGAGVTRRTIPVTIRDDRATERAETIGVTLSAASANTVVGSPDSTTITIRPSDQRPDASISKARRTGYVGDGVYNRTGAGQTRIARARRTQVRTFFVRMQNDGNVKNTFAVKGSAAPAGTRVRYFVRGTNVTRAMRSDAGWRVRLAPGRRTLVEVRVKIRKGAAIGTRKAVKVRGVWIGDGRRVDVAKAVVKVVR